jgi:cytosine/adenosine deaminase-related metal-dependent hydrolase
VCDIGNSALSRAIADIFEVECLFFQEMLGTTEKAAQAVLEAFPPDLQCTAHAPYSCHPTLLRALKERARQAGRLFPIHVAESADEIEFLQTGRGPFQHFLAERLRQVGALAEGQDLRELISPPGCGAVEYLYRLNLLDSRTICVHAVHIAAAEADLLAKTKAKVCLCPGSNRRLGVGAAEVSLLTQRQILPGLGTDSLTSNGCLDLWYEMQVLQEDHPDLSPELIFSMATHGGAETLGVSHRLGALGPGLASKMLAVDFTGSATDIYPFLVNNGKAINVQWLEAGYVS